MDKKNEVSVSLEAFRTGQNTVRVDAVVENAPRELFGAAFHLKADGDGWVLKKYAAGEVLAAPGTQPLIIAEEKTGEDGIKEIVFGISLKRSEEFVASDGVLASFYLQTEDDGGLGLKFADTRLVVLDPAPREIESAVWRPAEFNIGELGMDRREMRASVMQDFTGVPLLKSDVALVYMVMIGCLLGLLAVTAAYFYIRRRRRMRQEGN